MKTIGIVGGIAWPSTLVYYRTIHEYFKKRTGSNDLHTPSLLISQTYFALIEKAQEDGNCDEVGRLLAEQANRLKAAGADFFLLACNTVHAALAILQHTEKEYIGCLRFFWHALVEYQRGCNYGLKRPLRLLKSLMRRLETVVQERNMEESEVDD